MRSLLRLLLPAALCLASLSVGTAAEQRWDLTLDGFFDGGKKPLSLYTRVRDGEPIAVVGSSRDSASGENKKSFNRSYYYADMSGVKFADGKAAGPFTLHLTPDLWVPADHKPIVVKMILDARIEGQDQLSGEWKLVGVDRPLVTFGQGGKVTGTAKAADQPALPDPGTFHCNMQGALVGGDPGFGGRCMVLTLGFEGGKLTSLVHGVLSQKAEVFGNHPADPAGSDVTATPDRLAGRVAIETKTLDMEPATYVFEIDGRPMEGLITGLYKLTVKVPGKSDTVIDGSFDGRISPGIQRMAEADDRPWFSPVEDFQPPKPGEHPRLLFRAADVPALRAKATTPEGQAILQRLRQLLNGGDGETLPTVYNDSSAAYARKSEGDLPVGTYTIGHVAGYGLLYQLTGEKKYAQLGAQAFDKALAGMRDRDDRYSFREPGGALRAGPSIGWYAVGYDLCHEGWTPEQREKYGKAIWQYQAEGKGDNLEALARGTMPPGSNHFGMQIGGASLALLAVQGEPFVDAAEMEKLLAIAEQSTIRNISEGFGDGGFFDEGDGTGSMSSQIAYLTALAAWKNAAGRDFINVERPNARMLALKWMYQTVFRSGRPDVWPIRGGYGQNVWARGGVSGAGYFGIGLGAVPAREQAAMKWIYHHGLREADAKAGGPYDTISPYPHHAVAAFVNWPTDVAEIPPAEVLPHVYRDSTCGFYCWRDRWQDGDDTVITVLSNRTQGYMGAKPDSALMLNTRGKHVGWGTVKEGPTKFWATSPRGDTSSLTLADGVAFAVDFTGASGAGILLVTTGQAEGETVEVGGKKLTFHFPTADQPPKVEVQGDAAVVGKQRVTLKDGNLILAVAGE